MKPEILNLISYSGGKDSGALALHLVDQGVPNLVLAMCDTNWEHPLTMRYAYEFARKVGLRLVLLDSEGMEAMALRKGRAPSATRRFCTDELKLKPFRKYVAGLQERGLDVVVWVGVRAEESPSRAKLPCDEWSKEYNALLARGILKWTIAEVLEIHARYGVPMNPLYKLGMGRVGCMPCVMANKSELKAIAERFPEVYDKVAALEAKVGRTFWPPNRTPSKFCSKFDDVEREATDERPAFVERVPLATAYDVKTWALTERGQAPGQIAMFPEEPAACQSKYALCE